jgi:dienelactone hydrolase
MTVESPYSPNRAIELGPGVEGLRKERDRTVQSVVELRRAVDLLQSLPQVDDDRIGFVGYSAGARTGAILAGVEPRIRAFVFMSGGEDSVDEFMALVSEEDRPEVRPLLEDTDGLEYIARASPSKLFFQAGRKDKIVPRKALETLIRAGSIPKKVSWYDAGHDLALPKAQRDQLDWLTAVLEIEGPPVEGAETGP